MASGITPSSEVLSQITDLWKRKSEHRGATFKISDDGKEIVADKWLLKSDDETWDDFCQLFDNETCCWGIYMVPTYSKQSDTVIEDKPVGIAWIGELAKTKTRMMFGSTTVTFKQKVGSIDFKEVDSLAELQDIQDICDDKLKKAKYAGK